MRQIKFRAWSEHYQEMYYKDFDDVIEPENVKPIHTGLDADGNLIGGLFIENGDWEDLVLMQWTGLKDRNGVEIHEGDILKWIGTNKHVEGKEFENEVYWLDYRWRVKGSNNGKHWHSDLTFNMCLNHKVEVIRNIYEAKETVTP